MDLIDRIVSIIGITNTKETFEVPVRDLLGQQFIDIEDGRIPKVLKNKLVKSKIKESSSGQISIDGYNKETAFPGTPIGLIGFDASGNLITVSLNNTQKAVGNGFEVTITGKKNTVPIYGEDGNGLFNSEIVRYGTNYSVGGTDNNVPFHLWHVQSGSINIGQGTNSDGYRINNRLVVSVNNTTKEITIGDSLYQTSNIQKIKTETISFPVKSDAATAIAKLKVVYSFSGISDTNDGHVSVRVASNTLDATSDKVLGVMGEAIVSDEVAHVVQKGYLKDIDTSTFAVGAQLWLGTAGNITSTRPASPAHEVSIGYCVKSHATEGIIFVDVVGGFEIGELHDVLITSVALSHILVYDSVDKLWKNKSMNDIMWLLDGNDLIAEKTLGTKTGSNFDVPIIRGGIEQFRIKDTGVQIATISNATTNTNKFLVSDGGLVKYRTGVEVLSDIGAFASPIGLTTNYLPKWNGTTFVDSGTSDNGTLVTVRSGGTSVGVFGTQGLTLPTMVAGVANYNSFIVSDSGLLKTRTAPEMLTDLGAMAALNGTGYVKQSGITTTYDNRDFVDLTTNQNNINGIKTFIGGETRFGSASNYLAIDLTGGGFATLSAASRSINYRGFSHNFQSTSGAVWGRFTDTGLTYNGRLYPNGNASSFGQMLIGNGTTEVWRSLVSDDIPYLDFSKITTGIVPISQGGTGASSAASALINLGAMAALNGTGYVKQSGLITSYDNREFVDLTTTQTIGGLKTFTSQVKIANNQVHLTNDFLTENAGSDSFFYGVLSNKLGVGGLIFDAAVGRRFYFRLGNDRKALFNSSGLILSDVLGDDDVPTERLQVSGNIRYSLGLKPNNIGATIGQILSNDGTTDKWITPTYISGNQNITLSGDVTGAGTTAITTSILSTVVTGKLLTGYATLPPSGLTATDSILTAFGKLESLINGKETAFPRYDLTSTHLSIFNGANSVLSPVNISFQVVSGLTAGTYNNVTLSRYGIATAASNVAYLTSFTETDPMFVAWRDSSRITNTVYASPNGSSGAATFRTLVTADIGDFGTSGSYIKNGTTLQSSANFNISGSGYIGGNVGIGTTTPSRKLHIQDVSGSPQLVIGDGVSSFSSFQQADSLYLNAGEGGGNSSTFFRRGTGLLTSMIINSIGNVGINTTTPAQKLHVSGVIRQLGANNKLVFADSNGDLIDGSASNITSLLGYTPISSVNLTNTQIGFGASGVLSGSANFIWSGTQVSINGGTGQFNIGKGGADSEYWVDASGTNLNLYGTSVVSKTNFQLNAGLRAGGSLGGSGQVLTSNGSTTYWSTVSGGSQNLASVLSVGNTGSSGQNIILNNGYFSGDQYLFSGETWKIYKRYDGGTGTGISVSTLSGSGTRMVVADGNGVLSTQSIPSGGGSTPDLAAVTSVGSNTTSSISLFRSSGSGGYLIYDNSATPVFKGVIGHESNEFTIVSAVNTGMFIESRKDLTLKALDGTIKLGTISTDIIYMFNRRIKVGSATVNGVTKDVMYFD